MTTNPEQRASEPHKNIVKGWDERDYGLWSELQQLPYYGLIAPDDCMISRKQVVALMEQQALKRHKWREGFTEPRYDEMYEAGMKKLESL